TLLPQIRTEIREEFRTSSGPSDAGVNPPPVTIHTWLERFNKQKPHSFEKATAPKDFKKNTTVSTSGQANKKPGASGHVFAITEGHAANT
nr:zinc finger, CCHC-type, retrotransposon Gag domain protein [Tanacetum cinerariifolium]